MTGQGVVVTGIGTVTPAGIGVHRNWHRIVAGEPTAAVVPELAGLPVDIAGKVPDFDPVAHFGEVRARRLDRYVQLALIAAREAVSDAALAPDEWDSTRVGVVVGTGAGGTATMETQQTRLAESGPAKVSALTLPMGLPNMVAGQLALEFGAHGPNLAVCTACASGATAIGVARDLLRSGAADVVLTGGTEAVVTPLFVAAFSRMKALSRHRRDPRTASRPFDTGRDGFVIAEGAGILVLETEQHARGRGARAHARLAGYGASADAHHVTAPDPDGKGAEQAMRAALDDASITPREVQYVNAHGTSTPLNDVIEARAIRRVLGEHAAVSSTKGVTGHTLGAAGAIEAIYTILALQQGRIPPTANLDNLDPDIDLDIVAKTARQQSSLEAAVSNSFGFGGENAALIFTRC